MLKGTPCTPMHRVMHSNVCIGAVVRLKHSVDGLIIISVPLDRCLYIIQLPSDKSRNSVMIRFRNAAS